MGIKLNNNYLHTLQFADDRTVISNDKEVTEYGIRDEKTHRRNQNTYELGQQHRSLISIIIKNKPMPGVQIPGQLCLINPVLMNERKSRELDKPEEP